MNDYIALYRRTKELYDKQCNSTYPDHCLITGCFMGLVDLYIELCLLEDLMLESINPS